MQGQPGNPAFTRWSPAEYIADCIHLNDLGYGVYLDTIFDDAITPLICADSDVTASGCDTPPPTETPPPPTNTPQPATDTPESVQAEEQEGIGLPFIVGLGLLGAAALIALLFVSMRNNSKK